MTYLLATIGPCLLLTMVAVTPSTTEAINSKGPTVAQGGNLDASRPKASYSPLSGAANGSPGRESSTSAYLEVYRKQQRGLKEIKSNETQKDCLRFYYWSRRRSPRPTAVRVRSPSRLHYSYACSNDQFNGGANGDSRLAEHQ